jgi:hypothetical protein
MPDAPLLRRDRFFIALLLALVVGYGVLVEFRSAFMKHRHTDLGVYLRAAWAVREGGNPYAIVDDNGWHYSYPLLLAIVLVPLADPPSDVARTAWDVPFPVSVALWYLASIAALFWSVHVLCRVLDQTRPDGVAPPSPASRRFWWVRCWPIWICLPAIGSSLSRGQVNLFLVALLAAFIAAVLRGRRATAGWWLAAATCLKVIPALLVLYPLVRRDWRMLGHFALGLVVGLGLIPLAVFGPERAVSTTVAFAEGTILPGLTSKPGRLSRELTDMNATDNQSIQAVIHNALYLDRDTRPATAAFGTKLAHVLIGLTLIGWTLAASRRIPDERYRTFFTLGGLIILTVPITPVNHTHYMVLALPVVLGLVYREQELRGNFGWGAVLVVVMSLHLASGILPRLPFIPGYDAMRDLGVTMLGTLVVWWAGLSLPAGWRPLTLPRPAFAAWVFARLRPGRPAK